MIELSTVAQSSSQNENFVDTSQKLFKKWNWTFPVVRYFTLTLKFVSCILARILLLEFTLQLRCVFFCQFTVSFSTSELCYKCFSYNDMFFMMSGLRFLWYVFVTDENNVTTTFHFCLSLWLIFYYVIIRLFVCSM